MGTKITNNAYGTLAGAITSGATSIALTAGHGARFPVLAAGDQFFATLIDNSGNVEIIKVTARATDTLTVLRGQDGTAARAYSGGDRLELRPCNATAQSLRQEDLVVVQAAGTDTYTASLEVAPSGYQKQVYSVEIVNANLTSAPTINLNGLGAKTIKLAGGLALAAGDMPANHIALFIYNGTDMILLNPRSQAWTTGDAKITLKTAADTGWVMFDDGSIGNASSGATTRANADTSALFSLIWANVSNTWAATQDSTGAPVERGASAAADFAANRRLVLPKVLGRALAAAGTGAGLSARALGEILGSENAVVVTHNHGGTITSSGQSADHSHSGGFSPSQNNTAGSIPPYAGTNVQTGGSSNDHTHNVTIPNDGVSGTGKNMQPTSFFNVMVKL